MSQAQNTVPNGPSSEVADSNKNTYEPVKIPSSVNENPQQPFYTPQQIDGSPRPPLLRLDSRSTFQPRPGFPNPLLRPSQPRPPPPGGTPFIQRPPLPQRPPGPGQNIFQPPRPILPPNGSINLPRQPLPPGANVAVRPPIPFQRPGVRPQGIFQQRSVPAVGSPRPPFNSYQTPRSQTLDSSDINLSSQNVDSIDSVFMENKNETERPALAAMKNRSLSVSGTNVEPKPTTTEDRRRSISSVGSIEEEKRIPSGASDVVNGKTQNEPFSRPESRTETHMKKIEEDDNDLTSKKLPSNKSPSSINSSVENLEKLAPHVSGSPSPALTSQQPINRTPTPTAVGHSPLPQQEARINNVETGDKQKSPQAKSPIFGTENVQKPITPARCPVYGAENAEKQKSPVRGVKEFREENANIEKPDRRTPDLKPTSSPRLKLFKPEGDNDSGVDESTQGNDPLSNGDQTSPKKSIKSATPRSSTTPTKNKSFTRGAKSPNPKSPDTPTGSTPGTADRKKVPMNKVQVGSAPSPNLKVVKSKIGSLQNASYKPGGGHVKIESRKVDFSTASSRIAAKNDTYSPGGGDKKIQQQKLAWSAKPKVGSLDNATHKPKGGEKKIESVKLDFKDKAKAKIGSKDNMKHVAGGGDVKSEPEQDEIKKDIETKKLDIKVQSKIGSLGNLKHKPGGGDKKIFDDKDYLRQMSANSNPSLDGSQRRHMEHLGEMYHFHLETAAHKLHRKKSRPKSIDLNSPEINLISPTQHKVRIMEEVRIHEIPDSRPSSRLSRCGSAKSKRPATPRPPWRY